jgi:hypothetical protein
MASIWVKNTHVGGFQVIGDKMAIDKSEDTRYPYTYAADYIRSLAGYIAPDYTSGTKLSRADAAKIKEKIAEIIGMSEQELAEKLADYYLEHEDAISEKSSQEFLSMYTDRK